MRFLAFFGDLVKLFPEPGVELIARQLIGFVHYHCFRLTHEMPSSEIRSSRSLKDISSINSVSLIIQCIIDLLSPWR